VIINPDNPDLYREIEQFLMDSGIQVESIPMTIVVNPPIQTVIDDVEKLSEVLTDLLAAYRTEGNYFLEIRTAATGIVAAFGIEHTGTSITTRPGNC
jgi:hypothetical protein